MVFVIQNTQNRDALAVHLKLDELISSVQEADNALMRAEDETDEELAILKAKYAALSKKHAALQSQLQSVTSDGSAPTAGQPGA
jgi:low affinity Fe/Cu permease